MEPKKRSIVVTGIGVISSLGFDTEQFFERLCAGEDGTRRITGIDTKNFRRLNAAEIKEPLPYVERWKNYSRASRMALLATQQAIEDAGIELSSLGGRAAVSLGSMIGGTSEIDRVFCETGGESLTFEHGDLIKQYPLEATADTICYEMKIGGLRNTVMTACASGTTAIGIAYQWIQRGRADVVICGGYDVFRPLTHLGLGSFRIITPEKVRPFDIKRKGTLVGEGAGILILESEEHSRNRGAKIYCRVFGYGASCDANDLAHPKENGWGMGIALQRALQDAQIEKEAVGYINAHGTGTEKNDSAEIAAVKRVFGEHAYSLCVSSIKGAIGHTIGAAGAIEAVTTVLALFHQKVPPTINLGQQDPLCDLDIIPHRGRTAELEAAISNSFGFGGNNASLIFGRG